MARCDLFLTIVLVLSFSKCLLIPSYRSTDFEVHRNWLAITHSLPISKWYYENTSEWTLDYPPLFAWFEWCLSQMASFFDPAMLDMSNLNYSSPQTVLFQRLTVIIADLVLVYAVHQFGKYILQMKRASKSEPIDPWSDPYIIFAMLILWNPGLIILDHVHFQYNGFLMGMFLLSIVRIMQGRAIEGTFWFCLLINLKHIYLYVAPAYFIYLLRTMCFQPGQNRFSLPHFVKLATTVVSVFALSFGPFIAMGQTKQVLARLFPFKRGLTHAYWAPNFWAIYNVADKMLTIIAKLFGFEFSSSSGSMTGGLVQEYTHTFLPSISPLATLVLAAISLLPGLYLIWCCPNDPWNFVRSLVICALGSFLFGWHVHEKAILLVILPLTPLVMVSYRESRTFALLAPVAHFSLLPLLFKPAETPIKLLLLLMHTVYIFTTMKQLHREKKQKGLLPFLNYAESIFVIGLIPLQVFYSFGTRLTGIERKLPFVNLLAVSVYCSLAVIVSYFRLIRQALMQVKKETGKI